ncbi:MAG: methyltransferase domain-containing protein [Rhodospirillales bacterium]|nr:MAG: methyltransferase domain-containing protein [Rhodospirillales bacterium]
MAQTPEPRLDTTRLQALALAYQQSAAIMAAVELDVFTAISKGADTIPKLAAALDITARNAERLLTALTAMTLLRKTGATYANAADVERFLVKGSPRYAGPWITFTKPRWDRWGKLSEALKVKVEKVLGDYENFTVEDARRYHAATNSIGMGAGRLFCKQVDLSTRKSLLDLGGGSGAYSIVATQTWPGLKAVVLDLPPVCVVANDYIAQHGVADRVSTLPGDFTKTPFPGGVDAVVMASNLPQYSPELIQLVVDKAFAALAPGGEMHLVGEMLNDERDGPLNPSLWGLNEAVFNSTGMAHSEADVRGYFARAGFTGVTVNAFIPGILSRVTGRKPA